mgnify:CR=1 FL=1
MKRTTKLILILGAIAALGPLSIDTYLAAFPEIKRDLNTEINYVSLTLTAYFIGIAIGQLINGPILDRYGRKRPLIIGLSLYFFATLACSTANSIEVLIALRFLMALGGSVGMVATRAIIRDNFEHNDIARAFSALILIMGVAPILAPMLGGLILKSFGWRPIFWFLSGYVLLILLSIIFLLRESKEKDPAVSLNPSTVLFNYIELLKKPRFLLYALAGMTGMAAMFTYISASPFVIREVLVFDEIYFGWIFGSNALGYIGASQLNRYLLKSHDIRKVSKVVAIIFGISGSLLLLQVLTGLSFPLVFLINQFVFLSMLGFINPNMQALALEPFPKQAGIASALLGAIRMLMGTLASGLVSLWHDGSALPMASIMAFCGIALIVILWNRNWATSAHKEFA